MGSSIRSLVAQYAHGQLISLMGRWVRSWAALYAHWQLSTLMGSSLRSWAIYKKGKITTVFFYLLPWNINKRQIPTAHEFLYRLNHRKCNISVMDHSTHGSSYLSWVSVKILEKSFRKMFSTAFEISGGISLPD